MWSVSKNKYTVSLRTSNLSKVIWEEAGVSPECFCTADALPIRYTSLPDFIQKFAPYRGEGDLVKGKVLPYSLPSVGPRADPGVQEVGTQVTISHLPDGIGCHYFCQAWGYLPSRTASPPIGRYQILLLGDRGTCVWAACPRLLHGNGPAKIRTRDLLGRERTIYRYATNATGFHLIHGTLGPNNPSSQTATRSSQPFSRIHGRYQRTDKHAERRTDGQNGHGTRPVTTGCLRYMCDVA